MSIKTILKQLNKRPISYYSFYADIMGSVSGGVYMSQVMYWWGAMQGDEFYKIDRELIDETRLSVREFRSAKAQFKKFDFVEIKAKGVPAKTHYKIDSDKFLEYIYSFNDGVQTTINDGVETKDNDGVQTINTEITKDYSKNTSNNNTSLKNSDDFIWLDYTLDEIKRWILTDNINWPEEGNQLGNLQLFRDKWRVNINRKCIATIESIEHAKNYLIEQVNLLNQPKKDTSASGNGEASAPKVVRGKGAELNKAIDKAITYLNEKTNSNYRLTTKATRRLIAARLKEKFTLVDIKTVIDKKTEEWTGTEFEQYLRPETLFCAKHFESYLNGKSSKKKEKKRKWETE